MPAKDDVRFLALLVHEGLLTREQATSCLQQAREASGSIEVAAVELGLFSGEEFRRLRRTEAGTRPELARYEIRATLGAGGTATVYRAADRTSGAEVALKVLLPARAADPLSVARFVEEAKLLIRLRHDGIVRGHRVARESGSYYFVMDLVAGETTLEPLLRGEVFAEDDALAIVLQVARALEYLRSQGVVHRDIKPGNIMWTPDARAVLIDLGFAAAGRTGEDSDTTVGTVQYISPEQAEGKGDLDVRSDIYSLGATLYHLALGELPFEGPDDHDILRKQVLESLSSERIRSRKLSTHLHYFIEKMMAKEREIRYQTPAELIADMEAQLTGRAALQPAVTPSERKPLARPHRRRRRRR
jgi:serine/threonine-protein kinase